MVHFAFAIHYEKLKDTNAMIRSRKTMKERQYNDQKKKDDTTKQIFHKTFCGKTKDIFLRQQAGAVPAHVPPF